MEPAGRDVLKWKIEGPVAAIRLSRPEALNALNRGVFEALSEALDAIEAEPSVRAVVIEGEGERAFCAGADLDELEGLSGAEARALLGRGQRLFRRIEQLRVPSIAAVRGYALGGGFELALSCSLIVAARSARFGLPEAGLGLIPGYGGTQRLTRAIGANAALSCMITDDRIDAERAWQLGLLARPPVAPEKLEGLAREVAGQIAARGPLAVSLILDAVDKVTPTETGLRHEAALAALATSSADAAEGIAAFLAKRPPAFEEGPR